MLYSMTGFGREESMVGPYQVTIEVKSLNGKQLDINTRIASVLRAFEPEIRSLAGSKLYRGTVDVTISVRQDGMSRPMTINTELAGSYYRGMLEVAEALGLKQENTLPTLMAMPDVVSQQQESLTDDDWNSIRLILDKALNHLVLHRKTEGSALYKDLQNSIAGIESGLASVLPFEGGRIERIRERINGSLEEWVGAANIDKNRLEQELIYYIERIDFSEEKIRLAQHCRYFTEIMNSDEEAKGKKLGFVLQEVGREINTLGSKANDAEIQKIVVGMKDLLEKAKEQVLNVL